MGERRKQASNQAERESKQGRDDGSFHTVKKTPNNLISEYHVTRVYTPIYSHTL